VVQTVPPTLFAELVTLNGEIRRYRVWCDQCQDFHYHGPMDGHREAHCRNPDSLYHRTGYVIVLSGGSAESFAD